MPPLGRTFKEISDIQKLKRLRMTNNGFYGDTFSDGFGVFQTMKKRGFQVTMCIISFEFESNDYNS